MKSLSKMKIKKSFIIMIVYLVAMFLSFAGYGQSDPGLSGTWINEKGNRKTMFQAEGETFVGKVAWVADPGDKLKVGDIVFRDLRWKNGKLRGTATTPQGDMDCAIVLDGENQLRITVSKGLLSKTLVMTKTDH